MPRHVHPRPPTGVRLDGGQRWDLDERSQGDIVIIIGSKSSSSELVCSWLQQVPVIAAAADVIGRKPSLWGNYLDATVEQRSHSFFIRHCNDRLP